MSESKTMTEQDMLDAISEYAAGDQQYSHQTILALVRSLLGQAGPDGVHLTAVEVSGLYDLLGLIETPYRTVMPGLTHRAVMPNHGT